MSQTPDLTKLRPILFWDTDINKIDWQVQARAVIRRIFERGNDHEKAEIFNFYGEELIYEVTGSRSVTNNSLRVMSHLKVPEKRSK